VVSKNHSRVLAPHLRWLALTSVRCYLLCAVRSRLPRVFIIVALCLSIGAHWAALQSVAWATMLVQNAKQAPIARAIAQTFDGEHPCNLCKGVAAAQGSEKKRDAQPLTAKPDLICATRTIALLPRVSDHIFAPFYALAPERIFTPPTPPPRFGRA
jgi:hypothetical protein